MGKFSCFKNLSTVATKALSKEAVDTVAGNTVCFCSGKPKMLRCEGLRRCNFGCSRITILVSYFYRFYSKVQLSKRSPFSVSAFVTQSHILLPSMNEGIVTVKCRRERSSGLIYLGFVMTNLGLQPLQYFPYTRNTFHYCG